MGLATGTPDGGSDSIDLYHRAFKKISHVDPAINTEVIPSRENGWKFELFMQNFLPKVEPGRLGVLTVDRASEFAPVKNANGGDGTLIPDSPAMIRKMVLTEHKRWLERCTGLKIAPATKGNIEVSFLLSYAGENLEALQHKYSAEIMSGDFGYLDFEGDYSRCMMYDR